MSKFYVIIKIYNQILIGMSEKNKPEPVKIPKPIFLYLLMGITVFLDIFGFILFALSFVGAGIALSFLSDVIGGFSTFIFITIQILSDTRFLLKEVENIKNQAKTDLSGDKSKSNIGATIVTKVKDKISKHFLQFRLNSFIINLFVTAIEAIPFIGDFSPTYTIGVFVIITRRGNMLGDVTKIINKVKVSIRNASSVVVGKRR